MGKVAVCNADVPYGISATPLPIQLPTKEPGQAEDGPVLGLRHMTESTTLKPSKLWSPQWPPQHSTMTGNADPPAWVHTLLCQLLPWHSSLQLWAWVSSLMTAGSRDDVPQCCEHHASHSTKCRQQACHGKRQQRQSSTKQSDAHWNDKENATRRSLQCACKPAVLYNPEQEA